MASTTNHEEGELKSYSQDRSVYQRQFAALLNDNFYAIIEIDLNGQIATWNRGAQRIYGYSASQALSMNIRDFIPKERQVEAQELLDNIARGKTVRLLESDRLARGGRSIRVWLSINPVYDDNNAIIGAIAIERDFTASQQTREEIRQLNEELVKRTDELNKRQERSRIILETAPDAIIIIDDGGVVREFNQAAVDTFGYSAKEAIGCNVSMLMPSPFQEHHNGYIANYRKTGKSRVFCQRRVVVGLRKNGTKFPMALTVSEIDQMGLFVGIARDISARRQLQSDLAKARNSEQERIGREIHDGLGQRLTGLSMMAASLRLKLAESYSPHTEIAKEISEQLNLAIDEARRIAHGLSPLQQINGGLADMLALLAADTRKATGIAVCFENLTGQPGLVEDRTAAMQLYRITQEAINNAIKHANANTISIKLLIDNDGEAQLLVVDDGCGFEYHHDDKEGIGLRVMRYRADVIGCELTIESSPGEGTCIRNKLGSLLLPDAGLTE